MRQSAFAFFAFPAAILPLKTVGAAKSAKSASGTTGQPARTILRTLGTTDYWTGHTDWATQHLSRRSKHQQHHHHHYHPILCSYHHRHTVTVTRIAAYHASRASLPLSALHAPSHLSLCSSLLPTCEALHSQLFVACREPWPCADVRTVRLRSRACLCCDRPSSTRSPEASERARLTASASSP